MPNISSFMTTDHRDCDDAFVDFENIIAGGLSSDAQWDELKRLWHVFSSRISHHFEMEETVLFPAFEEVTGMMTGPTMVMRAEHQQMHQLISEIELAVSSRNAEQCQGVAETLMMMMQQHNMKEEQMLYPMTDQHVNAETVIDSMQAVEL